MTLNSIKNRILGKKKAFQDLCKTNNLTIDFKSNIKEYEVLKSIFEEREYADYFPFYKEVTIVDIGAHYGYFSLFAHYNTNPNSRIFAIEPDKDNFKHLQQNIHDCEVNNIESCCFAIAGKTGITKLYKGENVNHSLIENNSLLYDNKKYDEVEVRTLEELINENKIDHVDFLKMDCEGAEYTILQNLSDKIYDKITCISLEFHDLKDKDLNAALIISILTKKGFEIVKYNYSKTKRNLNFGKIIDTKVSQKST